MTICLIGSYCVRISRNIVFTGILFSLLGVGQVCISKTVSIRLEGHPIYVFNGLPKTEGWGEDLFASRTQLARVVIMEKEIPSGVEVFPYERVSKFIDEAKYLALSVCYCRHEKELLDKSCGKSKDVCLQFGPFARYVVERGFGREITKDEAYRVLDKAEEEGLVHLSDNSQKHINFICNC